jgi:hypothetical protein
MLVGHEVASGEPPALVLGVVADEEHASVAPAGDDVADEVDLRPFVGHRVFLHF